jgi:cold-inducible RNA-binding protein
MEDKLFVNNMSFETKEEEIRELFKEFGEITELKMITDRETGRFRGFGFITFSSAEEANLAKEALNGKELNGREISVEVARPQENRGGNKGFGNRQGGSFRKRY